MSHLILCEKLFYYISLVECVCGRMNTNKRYSKIEKRKLYKMIKKLGARAVKYSFLS